MTNGGWFSATRRDGNDAVVSQARIIVGDVDNGSGGVIVDGVASTAGGPVASTLEASVLYSATEAPTPPARSTSPTAAG